nr:immunoglobulin heavy chain junction region [Macaca mulatta]
CARERRIQMQLIIFDYW